MLGSITQIVDVRKRRKSSLQQCGFNLVILFSINWNRLSAIFTMHGVIWQKNRDMFMTQHRKKKKTLSPVDDRKY